MEKTAKTELTKGWYVLRAISGKEAKVKELLDGVIKNTPLGDYVFQVLIPTEKVLTVRGGKKVVKERNLYSGYVLLKPSSREKLSRYSQTPPTLSTSCVAAEKTPSPNASVNQR